MTQDRIKLRTTFDQDAQLYDQARPHYPETLFDNIVTFSALPADGRVLEIGCGTGQATVPMARRGYRIQCIEMGANMVAIARHNLKDYPLVEIHNDTFEGWPLQEESFDLALSATAFHWIDPAISYQKAARALKPGGTLALFWYIHVQSKASQSFFEEVQPIYRREFPNSEKINSTLPWPDEVAEPVKAEIEQTNLFGIVTVNRYCWDVIYNSESYLRLLNTYSDHRVQDSQQRERLFQGIAELIDSRFHGSITKGYLAMLYLAHRK